MRSIIGPFLGRSVMGTVTIPLNLEFFKDSDLIYGTDKVEMFPLCFVSFRGPCVNPVLISDLPDLRISLSLKIEVLTDCFEPCTIKTCSGSLIISLSKGTIQDPCKHWIVKNIYTE